VIFLQSFGHFRQAGVEERECGSAQMSVTVAISRGNSRQQLIPARFWRPAHMKFSGGDSFQEDLLEAQVSTCPGIATPCLSRYPLILHTS